MTNAGKDFQEHDERVGPFTRQQLSWMLVFTVVGAVLRLHSLGSWSMWVDEAHTFRDVVAPIEEFWRRGTSNYPLSFLLLRNLADWLGLAPADLTEEVMRLPFAFFGIASIPTLAIVARGMVGAQSALLAALFLALSPWHIYWSQSARFYTMELFFSLVAIGAAYHGFHRRSWPMLGAAVLAFFISGFCHPSAYIVMASAALYLLLATVVHSGKDSGFAKWGALGTLSLLVVVVVLIQPVLKTMIEVKQPQFSLFHLAQTMVFYVGVPVLMAAVGGMLYLFDRRAPAATFLAVMFVLPLLVLSILSTTGIQTVSAQYAFATLPAIYILAACLIMALARVFSGSGIRAMVLKMVPLGMIVFHMLGQDYLYCMKEYGWRPRWREAVEYIDAHARQTGLARVRVLTTNGPSIRYYVDPAKYSADEQRGGTVKVRPLVPWHLKKGPEAMIDAVVKLAEANGESLWVVLTEPELEEMDLDGRANATFRKRFRQVRRLPNWTGPKDMTILVYYYEPPPKR